MTCEEPCVFARQLSIVQTLEVATVRGRAGDAQHAADCCCCRCYRRRCCLHIKPSVLPYDIQYTSVLPYDIQYTSVLPYDIQHTSVLPYGIQYTSVLPYDIQYTFVLPYDIQYTRPFYLTTSSTQCTSQSDSSKKLSGK